MRAYFRVPDHLQYRLYRFLQCRDGEDAFPILASQKLRHALRDVIRQPPLPIARFASGADERAHQPIACESDTSAISEPNEGQIVFEGNHRTELDVKIPAENRQTATGPASSDFRSRTF